MTQREEALQLLLDERHACVDELTALVQQRREACERRPASGRRFDELALRVARLENVISAMMAEAKSDARASQSAADDSGEGIPADGDTRSHRRYHVLDRFLDLISQQRLEEASRSLKNTFRLTYERSIGATQFFAAALPGQPTLLDDLMRVCNQIDKMNNSECMKILVSAFGFQAVESARAIALLRARIHAAAEPQQPVQAFA